MELNACLVICAGPSFALLDFKPNIFTINTNFHYSEGNITFTTDEPVIGELVLSEKREQFGHQFLFVNAPAYKSPEMQLRPWVYEFDHYQYFEEPQSFSSGSNAIGLATKLRFSTVYLIGADWLDKQLPLAVGQNYKDCYLSIRDPNIKYIKIDFEEHPEQPWFDEIITIQKFKEIVGEK